MRKPQSPLERRIVFAIQALWLLAGIALIAYGAWDADFSALGSPKGTAARRDFGICVLIMMAGAVLVVLAIASFIGAARSKGQLPQDARSDP